MGEPKISEPIRYGCWEIGPEWREVLTRNPDWRSGWPEEGKYDKRYEFKSTYRAVRTEFPCQCIGPFRSIKAAKEHIDFLEKWDIPWLTEYLKKSYERDAENKRLRASKRREEYVREKSLRRA